MGVKRASCIVTKNKTQAKKSASIASFWFIKKYFIKRTRSLLAGRVSSLILCLLQYSWILIVIILFIRMWPYSARFPLYVLHTTRIQSVHSWSCILKYACGNAELIPWNYNRRTVIDIRIQHVIDPNIKPARIYLHQQTRFWQLRLYETPYDSVLIYTE